MAIITSLGRRRIADGVTLVEGYSRDSCGLRAEVFAVSAFARTATHLVRSMGWSVNSDRRRALRASAAPALGASQNVPVPVAIGGAHFETEGQGSVLFKRASSLFAPDA